MAFLVDVPGNDAVHDAYLRCCRLPPLQPSLRRLAPNGIDGSAVGHQLFSVGDSGRTLCQRRDSEGRVSGKEGRDSLWSVALTATVSDFWASDSSATPGKTNVRIGSSTDLTAPKSDFRFTPESGLKSDIGPCPFRAKFGSSRLIRSLRRRRPEASSVRRRRYGDR